MVLTEFFYLIREYGVPASVRDLLDLYRGIEKGLVSTLDDFFVFSRLTFVRHVEHMDAFERAFAFYFHGVDIPHVAEGNLDLLRTRPFRKWLEEAIKRGELPKSAIWTMNPEELMKKFWETLREQTEAHHGGSKWIGTRGNSPFGHSGNAKNGVRVGGRSGGRSALKVIGDRRYVDYSESQSLNNENIRQALETMKHMKKAGAPHVLNLDETIRVSARNGGDIELVFDRELRDKMTILLLIDNGGYSMDPHVPLTQLLFSRLHDRFKDIRTYYFHNTIYATVWSDPRRTRPVWLEKILLENPETRIVVIGDASMAPEELLDPMGAISLESDDAKPSLDRLKSLAERFRYNCWLNPIPRNEWAHTYGRYTLNLIREVLHMEDMTLRGIKAMSNQLSSRHGRS